MSRLQQQQQAGQNQHQSQPRMMQPPNVISTKDSLYLRDQMSWLLMTMKKCAHFANECTDANIGQAIDKVGKLHERHYNLLLGHLQTNNNQAMQNVPQPTQPQ